GWALDCEWSFSSERSFSDDALDRWNQPEVSVPGDRHRRGLDVLRHRTGSAHAGGRLPRVRAAARRGSDDLPRAHRGRSRKPGDRSDGAGARRIAGPRRPALQIGLPAVVGQNAVQAWDRPAAGAADGGRAYRDGHSLHAEVGGPADRVATAVVDEPDDEDRDLVKNPVRDGLVDDHLLDHPTAPAARTRCGQRRHLGRAAPNAERQRRPGTDAEAPDHARRGHDGHGRCPRLRYVHVLAGPSYRYGRVDRYSQSTAPGPARRAPRVQV